MKTEPVVPAKWVFGPDGTALRSATVGAIDHPPADALDQARRVFLHGSGLPLRWAGRDQFTLLDTGFGLGHNFLATWQAWRGDPQRCTRLHVVALECHPPTRADLALAHARATEPLQDLAIALLAAWPPLTANLHLLDFDEGRVQLLLGFGDTARLLPAVQARVDAFNLRGAPTAGSPQMWRPRLLKALAQKAAPGATLTSSCTAPELQRCLRSAGFAVAHAAEDGDGASRFTQATYAPAFVPRRAAVDDRPAPGNAARAAATAPAASSATAAMSATTLPNPAPGASAQTPSVTHDAVVIGAGIAGASVALALAQQGLTVTVFDRHALPAQETSGNPAGLFHGTVHAGDGSYARLYRAAALHAQQVYAQACAHGVPGSPAGLLRLASPQDTLPAMQHLLQQLGLPADYVSAVAAGVASQLAGVPLQHPAWLYAGGGWIAPPAWVLHALDRPGIGFVGGCAITGLQRHGAHWLLRDAQGRVVARTAIVVLANAAVAGSLLAPLGHRPWPLSHTRGQVTFWQGADTGLRLPVAGDGYAVPLGHGALLCGATRASVPATVQADTSPRLQDHLQNLERLQRLTGIAAPSDAARLQGRTGWRLHADDQLPIAGALPLAAMPAGQRRDQARLLPREPGLFVLTALGSRGLTLAPLLGRLVAAQATGAPWPLEQDLADAVDPSRWLVRAARSAQGARAAGPSSGTQAEVG